MASLAIAAKSPPKASKISRLIRRISSTMGSRFMRNFSRE
jgi:hypothetical protein